jgi:hypothetical protein
MVATIGTGQGPYPSTAVSSFLNNYWSQAAPKSITAINGSIFATTRRGAGSLSGLITGMTELGFIEDTCYFTNDSNKYKFNRAMVGRDIVAFDYTIYTTGGIANVNGNDLAITVLPNAPIDADTGLPVPTIAVATDGGVSIIKDNGSVVDITNGQDSSAFNYIDNLFFRKDGALVWVGDSSTNTAAERFLQVLHNLPNADTNQGTVEGNSVIDEQYGPSHKTGSKLRWATTAGVKATSDAGENFAVGTSGALHLLKYNREVEQEGSIAHITSD